jgi:hypothetical protein
VPYEHDIRVDGHAQCLALGTTLVTALRPAGDLLLAAVWVDAVAEPGSTRTVAELLLRSRIVWFSYSAGVYTMRFEGDLGHVDLEAISPWCVDPSSFVPPQIHEAGSTATAEARADAPRAYELRLLVDETVVSVAVDDEGTLRMDFESGRRLTVPGRTDSSTSRGRFILPPRRRTAATSPATMAGR